MIREGIIQEAGGHDMVLLGVSEESLLDRIVFGSIPLQVAARVRSVGLVQASRGVTGVWTRRIVRALGRAFPGSRVLGDFQEDQQLQAAIGEVLERAGQDWRTISQYRDTFGEPSTAQAK